MHCCSHEEQQRQLAFHKIGAVYNFTLVKCVYGLGRAFRNERDDNEQREQ